ncbi:embryogenesis-associated protein EMB8 isoform X2 [Daucus carota subsp. sativus]|uniref:embryogenesis-associated protein EMB8 isoform X2 n=1 Tax=Daucus carota subsp. sativus TaxID=79200 RepID=UPI0007F03ED5|nr:PREDICTED: embryogenesis-associated protein EMB8-like isoform X2 [Daucus carota subsp. sativus]
MEVCSQINGYKLLLKALIMIPISHYVVGLLCVLIIFLYNFLEFHFLDHLFNGGCWVKLTYLPGSELHQAVISKCKLLHGRYSATPWLASPHLQTILLPYACKPPAFTYRREIFHSSDGGSFALDWLLSSDVLGSSANKNADISKNSTTPIVVVVPGLTSDSSAPYVRSLSLDSAKQGWNVVVCNHRGMCGISFTSSYFYNAGKTKDLRDVLNYLVGSYPMAPIFLVGTSIGANIVGKYLGEDGDKCPVAGAAVICGPWDLLICSRFLGRGLVQRVYDRALAIGLKSYAQFRVFFGNLIRVQPALLTKLRWSSCASYVKGVSVPLLSISSMDDPVCTAEAIPWDECRANKNVVLATTKHGGHLGYFEGLTASSLWWVRTVNEFFGVLHSSPLVHKQKVQSHEECTSENSKSSDST